MPLLPGLGVPVCSSRPGNALGPTIGSLASHPPRSDPSPCVWGVYGLWKEGMVLGTPVQVCSGQAASDRQIKSEFEVRAPRSHKSPGDDTQRKLSGHSWAGMAQGADTVRGWNPSRLSCRLASGDSAYR